MLWTSNLTTVTRPWQESRKPSTTVTKSSIFDLAGDLNSPLGVWLWKNYSVLLKNLYLQLCWGFKHLICSAGKLSLEEFLEHWSTGVSDVTITWLWRNKRLSCHPHLFFFSSSFLSVLLDGLAKCIFKFLSNCCFECVWPRSESTIWYAMCFQPMSFTNKQ